jgi:hypothetical protein
MDLVIQLERGGADGFNRPPVVWRVDEPFALHSLQRRFAEHWAGWYGPVLQTHALAIARQLKGLQAQDGDASAWAGGPAQPLSRWWAMPVVRRRSRRLRISLAPSAAGTRPGWPWSDSPGNGPAGSAGLQLGLRLHQFWGAASDQTAQPGPAVWCACDERVPTKPLSLPRWRQDRATIEHRLHDGIGLLVLVPGLWPGDAQHAQIG